MNAIKVKIQIEVSGPAVAHRSRREATIEYRSDDELRHKMAEVVNLSKAQAIQAAIKKEDTCEPTNR